MSTDEETRAKARQRAKEWRARNRERHRAYSRQWEKDHPEQVADTHRTWVDKNRDSVRDIKRTHRAKRRTRQEPAATAVGDFATAEWRALCTWFNHRCVACGKKRALTVDHVQPLREGGANIISNIQPLCQRCNGIKAKRTIDYRDPVMLAAFLESIKQ